MLSTLLSTSPASPAVSTKRRGSSGSTISTNDWRARNTEQFEMGGLGDVFGSVDGEVAAPVPKIPASSNTSYPGVADGDPILQSKWDKLGGDGAVGRRLSFLCYSDGLQIWDCTSLASVSEILNCPARIGDASRSREFYLLHLNWKSTRSYRRDHWLVWPLAPGADRHFLSTPSAHTKTKLSS